MTSQWADQRIAVGSAGQGRKITSATRYHLRPGRTWGNGERVSLPDDPWSAGGWAAIGVSSLGGSPSWSPTRQIQPSCLFCPS